MKNVEQGFQGTVSRRLPMWIFIGALACLGAGVLILHDPAHHASAASPEAVNTVQSQEIERLKQAVSLLEHKSTASGVAVSSEHHDADLRPRENEASKAPEGIEDTRSTTEIQQAEITDLEVRFAAEKDGSRESLVAAQKMQAELNAAPLGEARVTDVACSSSLCRATLEQDAKAKPMDMSALIAATPSVKQESMFDYSEEGTVKRVTIYSAREGHKLIPSPNAGAGSQVN